MSMAQELTVPSWSHSSADNRIEDIGEENPDLAEVIGRLALRFISEKGLAGEFADILEEIAETQDPPYIRDDDSSG